MAPIPVILTALLVAGTVVQPAEPICVPLPEHACCCSPEVQATPSCCAAPERPTTSKPCDCHVNPSDAPPLRATCATVLTETGPRFPATVLWVLSGSDYQRWIAGPAGSTRRGHDPPVWVARSGRQMYLVLCSLTC